MNRKSLDRLHTVFLEYASLFEEGEEGLPPLLQLKLDHSLRVAREAHDIARDLHWPAARINLGEAAGLFHDVGRFSQLAEYGTFLDSASIDHGKRGCEVIERGDLLSACSAAQKSVILDSVRHHNRRTIPAGTPAASLPILQLVRDADKLDIMFVLDETLRNRSHDEHPEILLNIDLDGPPTPALIAEIRANRTGSYENLHSLVDLNVLRMTWVYDVSYCPTLSRMLARGFLDRILDGMPDDAGVRQVVSQALAHVHERLRSEAPPDAHIA